MLYVHYYAIIYQIEFHRFADNSDKIPAHYRLILISFHCSCFFFLLFHSFPALVSLSSLCLLRLHRNRDITSCWKSLVVWLYLQEEKKKTAQKTKYFGFGLLFLAPFKNWNTRIRVSLSPFFIPHCLLDYIWFDQNAKRVKWIFFSPNINTILFSLDSRLIFNSNL